MGLAGKRQGAGKFLMLSNKLLSICKRYSFYVSVKDKERKREKGVSECASREAKRGSSRWSVCWVPSVTSDWSTFRCDADTTFLSCIIIVTSHIIFYITHPTLSFLSLKHLVTLSASKCYINTYLFYLIFTGTPRNSLKAPINVPQIPPYYIFPPSGHR